MINIILQDNSNYKGIDERDIIMQLKLEDWTTYNNVDEYQENIKRRVKNFNGQEIKYANDKEFLEELNRIGFIKEIQIKA